MGKAKDKKKKAVEPVKVEPVYRVAKGRSLITKAGIKKPGEVVKPNYINGDIKDLVDKGYVEEV